MKKLPALILFIFVFISFFFIFPKTTPAAVLFQDDFNDGNADGWTVEYWTPSDPNDPVWQTFKWVVNANNQYGITLNDRQLRTFSSAGNTSWTDYIYKIQMLGKDGVDKNILFRYQNKNNWYGFHMLPSGVYFGMSINGSYSDTYVSNFSFVNNVPYELKIVLSGGFVSFYANNSPVVENYSMWSNPLTNGKIALYVSTGEQYPSSVWFDNVLVCDVEPCEPTPTITPTPTPTATPTPTPTPTPLQPLILLPGLGASWNHEAMILGASKPPEDWYMTPGVKSYDGIIQTFQNAGYTLGTNFFVFNYDWRKPVDEIANDLKEFLSRHPPPAGTKIDLVGHSLGGVVGRTYVQNNPDNQVDQLLTLGSPHKGAVKTYYLWEGAQLSKGLSGWQRIGAGILLQLKKRNFENNVETIQHAAPGLKDLLPTFSYLKINGVEKPISEMKQRNDWLGFLNQLPLPSPLISILNTFVGVKENSTLRYINVERQNQFDRFLGKWEDGKPVGEKYAGGDDAVLNFSASLDNAAHVINLLGFDHGDLVETIAGQQAIMNILGLSPSGIVAAPEITYEPSLVFQLASSVNMTILGPDGWQIGQGVENNIPNSTYSPENKFILIPNPLEGNYEIHVTSEEDGGSYQLIVGLITEGGDYWRVYQGVATPSSPGDHIFFSPTPNRLKSYLLTQSKATIFSLKKNFNKQKITPQLRGKIESKLAVCLGNINAALDLLEDSNNSSANQKIEKALLAILDLEEFLETNPDSLKDLFSNPLKGVKDLLFQAYEF